MIQKFSMAIFECFSCNHSSLRHFERADALRQYDFSADKLSRQYRGRQTQEKVQSLKFV